MSALAILAPRDCQAFDRAASFLGSILRPDDPRSLQTDHPAVFGEGRVGELRICKDGARLLGGAAIVKRQWSTPHGGIRLGLLGSVATDPSARGRGIARRVLTACERALAKDGCAIALLWADEPAFYEHLDYTAAGTETLCLVEKPRDRGFLRGCEEYTRQDLDMVERLRAAEPSHSDRSAAESAVAYASSGTRVYVHRDPRGALDAYVAVGRGQDLPGVAHESGGSREGILTLLDHAASLRPGGAGPLVAFVNPYRRDLLTRLRSRGAALHTGILGMAKVLDAAALRAELAAAYPPSAVKLLTEFSDADLLHATLGHRGTREPLTRLERQLGIAPISNFPRSPFVSGFESI